MTNKKNILILGGAFQHVKLALVAKELGYFTIVTDNLPYNDSPAKQVADHYWNTNIYSIDEIVKKCRDSNIDGIASAWLDPCQRPYADICKKLDLPSYGTVEQFLLMTDKTLFKGLCKKYGVDTIDDYDMHDYLNKKIDFPVFVKPVDSRGSRGQSICSDYNELKKGIEFAKKESSNGEFIIEKYLGDAQEIQVTYFFIDGNPYLIRTADSYKGSKNNGMEKVVVCSISPSQFTKEYLSKAHAKVINMFKGIGFKNGPIFMQGFYDNGTFKFFDPGLRFPGVDFDKLYQAEYDIDLAKMMIHYSIYGNMPMEQLPEDMYNLNGKRAAILFPTIKSGKIERIDGLTNLNCNRHIFSVLQRHHVGDIIDWSYNVNQRIAEIDVVADSTQELKELILDIQKKFNVFDENSNSMLFEEFDVERIDKQIKE